MTFATGCQYIYTEALFPGQIQKFTLEGKLVGQFGALWRTLGQSYR